MLLLFVLVLSVTTVHTFFLNPIQNATLIRNLTCASSLNSNETVSGCQLCIVKWYNDSLLLWEMSWSCNVYRSYITHRNCSGFSDTYDIGNGTCQGLPFETYPTFQLCICAEDLCNRNLTTCQDSVNRVLKDNSSTALTPLPLLIPDLHTPLTCRDDNLTLGLTDHCNTSHPTITNVQDCITYASQHVYMCGIGDYNYTERRYVAFADNDYAFWLDQSIPQTWAGLASHILFQIWTFSETDTMFHTNLTVVDENGTVYGLYQRCLCSTNGCNANLTTCQTSGSSEPVTTVTIIVTQVTSTKPTNLGNHLKASVVLLYHYVCMILLTILIQPSHIFH